MITVVPDPDLGIVRVSLDGMLTVAQVERFAADVAVAVRGMGRRSGEYDLLIEQRGELVQPQAVTEAFMGLIRNAPFKSRRLASVRDTPLGRMQSRRVSKEREDARVFATVADAEAWLTAP